jgi:hypothetical protein
MDIRTYRESQNRYNTRHAFCLWINADLADRGLSLSVSYLRDLESGRSCPSLPLAVAIEDITDNQVTTRDWAGLFKSK